MPLPTGTVTLVFTDVEGSTRLLQRLGRDRYVRAFEAHRRLLREAVAGHGGVEVEMQGDSFHFAFPRARAAVAAAAEAQRALARHAWEDEPVRVRVGIHTGEPMVDHGLYAGLDVHRAARVMGAGHGGQVLLSERTADLVDGELPEGTSLRDLGEHRLKDLSLPQRLWQLAIDGLDDDFPAPRTLENRATNLPAQLTPLVGRRRELDELAALLGSEDVRVVTLTGAGGIGKTRLALGVAAEAVDDFPGGVFLVALASIAEPALVLPTIARTLGLREQPDRPLTETIAVHVGDRRVLLLLDNLEHVLAAARALAELLAAARTLTVLATSRAPLRLSGEHEYAVPPLPVPDRTTPLGPKALAQYDAVRLFLDRVRTVRPGFALTAENAAAVAEICSRLDGLPLALELAAARTRILAPHALLARLDHPLRLLTGGARDADERQRTLRGTIDWSYRLLAPEEQVLFARLAVFAGGTTLEAAESVCSAGGAGVLDGLTSLVEKSLLRVAESPDGEPRFTLLEAVRAYALDRLHASGEEDEIRRRHLEHYVALAEGVGGGLRAPPRGALARLDSEHDNVRAALDWALGSGRGDDALRLSSAAAWYWDIRGHWSEAVRWLESALAVPDADPHLRARALYGLGVVTWSAGRLSESRVALEEALELFRAAGDPAYTALTLVDLSYAVLTLGDVSPALAQAREALRRAQELGDRWLVAHAEGAVAAALLEQDGVDAAAEMLERALAIFRECGDDVFVARAIGNVAWARLIQGRYGEARSLLEESLALAEPFGEAIVRNMAGNLGLAALFEGAHDEAESRLRSALAARTVWPNPRLDAESLWALAAVAAVRGDARRAAWLAGAAQAALDAVGSPPSPIELRIQERYLARARTGDAEAAFASGWEEGLAVSLDQAVARVLGGP